MIVGGGPAGLGPIYHAARVGELEDLLRKGVMILEKEDGGSQRETWARFPHLPSKIVCDFGRVRRRSPQCNFDFFRVGDRHDHVPTFWLVAASVRHTTHGEMPFHRAPAISPQSRTALVLVHPSTCQLTATPSEQLSWTSSTARMWLASSQPHCAVP